MKAKKFKEETRINLYEEINGKFELTDSTLAKGLLSLGEIEDVIFIDRNSNGKKEYKISKIENLIYDPFLFVISKPENESLRKIFCPRKIIQKVYYLYLKKD